METNLQPIKNTVVKIRETDSEPSTFSSEVINKNENNEPMKTVHESQGVKLKEVNAAISAGEFKIAKLSSDTDEDLDDDAPAFKDIDQIFGPKNVPPPSDKFYERSPPSAAFIKFQSVIRECLAHRLSSYCPESNNKSEIDIDDKRKVASDGFRIQSIELPGEDISSAVAAETLEVGKVSSETDEDDDEPAFKNVSQIYEPNISSPYDRDKGKGKSPQWKKFITEITKILEHESLSTCTESNDINNFDEETEDLSYCYRVLNHESEYFEENKVDLTTSAEASEIYQVSSETDDGPIQKNISKVFKPNCDQYERDRGKGKSPHWKQVMTNIKDSLIERKKTETNIYNSLFTWPLKVKQQDYNDYELPEPTYNCHPITGLKVDWDCLQNDHTGCDTNQLSYKTRLRQYINEQQGYRNEQQGYRQDYRGYENEQRVYKNDYGDDQRRKRTYSRGQDTQENEVYGSPQQIKQSYNPKPNHVEMPSYEESQPPKQNFNCELEYGRVQPPTRAYNQNKRFYNQGKYFNKVSDKSVKFGFNNLPHANTVKKVSTHLDSEDSQGSDRKATGRRTPPGGWVAVKPIQPGEFSNPQQVHELSELWDPPNWWE